MFAKLALKNIKRSIKDYAIYFFTLVLGVAIFYVFNALDSQTIMMDVTERIRNMLDLLNVIMNIVSVFISFILGALIVYASRFLIKRRSKEFGIYLTLGMSKRKIALILLIETFLIGLLSLAAGLALGVIVSQFTSILVANMFDANLTSFHFVFSFPAFVQTLIYFGIIYGVVMFFNTINVSRQKLINLLSSSKRNETVKMKNPWMCTAVFVFASVILGIAYYLVTDGLMSFMESSDGPEILLVPIIMGVIATFLLFWSLSGLLLRIFMSFKKIYYNKLNSFVLRQFSSKINTTVMSMSLICLMLFVTICVLGSAMSISSSLHEAIEQALPMDAEIISVGKSARPITEIYDEDGISVDEILEDIIIYNTYLVENISINNSLGNTVASIADGEVINHLGTTEQFIHLSDYNNLSSIFGLPALELNDDEYAVLANYRPMMDLRNSALKAGVPITIFGHQLKPKLDQCIDGTIELEMSNLNSGVIIVPDNIKFDGKKVYQREHLLGNYINPENSEENDNALDQIARRFYNTQNTNNDDANDGEIYYYSFISRQEIIDNNVGTSALVTFVGLYLGMIFLISSAAVLALKELSESSDNRTKYEVLRKIGTSERMLNSALFWQIFIFFLFPLAIAILHSVFGLIFCNFLLSTLGGIDIAKALPGVTLLLGLIYGGYFIITYFCSRNIIRSRRS